MTATNSSSSSSSVSTTEQGVVWKLRVEAGRQTWYPVESNGSQQLQTSIEKHFLTKKSNDTNPTYENEEPLFHSLKESLVQAMNFYTKIQTSDGHWGGDYGGPMFLLPGLLIVVYITDSMGEFHKAYFSQMERYIRSKQNADGGFGLHIEGHSTIFGTCLNYISLRILGVDPHDEQCVKARHFLHQRNGPLECPQWGKFYMCALNVMDYSCCEPAPPELWALPSWVPFVHPGKWWCHCRIVYLAMSYTYGRFAQCKETPLILALRKELYSEELPYDSVNWSQWRSVVHETDNYYPATWAWRLLSKVVVGYEKLVKWGVPGFTHLRNYSTDFCLDHIKFEDENSKFICIGPVNKVINMLSVYFAEGKSEHFKQHIPRLFDYLWLSDDGMKMQGYNGSQLWDTSFAVQALAACPRDVYEAIPSVREALQKAQNYIDISQVRHDVPHLKKYFRHISKGAWPFSTRDHGWPISDCTAEGLKATYTLMDIPFIVNQISDERLADAVNVILSMRNDNTKGWATYELTRTNPLVEYLNPAALFGDIMIDYTHTECTSASLQALLGFRKRFPNHRRQIIDEAIEGAVQCLRDRQGKDGSWYGFWAVCYCYGAWFGITGLAAVGGTYENDENIRRGCDFLVKQQLKDGGWGESYLSSERHEYISTSRSQIVNTSWVILTLIAAKYPYRSVIDTGIALLRRRQMGNGDFPQEQISGVFNGNCFISYSNYRNIFPIWAIGEYLQAFEQ
uniref:Terpene cyclase/mutase family member n=1 Tax=Percolomonas cosmopolitus TaxID=63605 RepID=A0A7S1KRP6_9EUKA|mmetsp:Transcript_4322/g.16267  ORF Transcript_4322/g.16267 Transcript_4322/m.16267 type:complete len:737 (+) Transcript_4322:113-2323(+)